MCLIERSPVILLKIGWRVNLDYNIGVTIYPLYIGLAQQVHECIDEAGETH